MIQEFSVQNFLSFKDKQTISFTASSDKTLSEELIYEPKSGVKILKMIVIYGANASGKSNLLQAIETLWMILFAPRDKEDESIGSFQPFELTKNEPTQFHVVFWAKERKYEYELTYNGSSILFERMKYTSDAGVLSDMYVRNFGEPIQFGSTLKMKAKQRDDFNKDTLHNHTVLSTLNKKNIDAPQIMKDLYEWIKTNVHELNVHYDSVKIAEQAESDPEIKSLILELLNKADFNISDFNLVDFKIPKEILDKIKDDNNLSETTKERLLKPQKQIIFSHETENEKFQISFGMESSGTQTYFRLARLLYDLKKGGNIFMEDELEDSLHYDLLLHYLQTYLQASCNSQLIFATHNQLLLDENWMIRRDMVWFVEKERQTSKSILYRASDMGIHKNLSLLNAYRIGKLGAKPVLGSTFLNSGKYETED